MDELWDRVDSLVARASGVGALRAHRLHLYAARLQREGGVVIGGDLREDVRRAEVTTIAAPLVLQRAREAYNGRMMVMKGPEAALLYPGDADRPFRDIDLLVDDAPAAQRAMLAAGFVALNGPAGDQHLPPLLWPGLPLHVEVHRRPNSPIWLPAVSADALLGMGVPSRMGVAGLLAPPPEAHALLLAVHSWAHQPLGALGDLIDAAAASWTVNRALTINLARRWRWDRIWKVTERVIDEVLRGRDSSLGPTTLWTRHLGAARERTVLEHHLTRLAAPAFAPTAQAPHAMLEAVRRTATPRHDERWADKLRRSRLALGHALTHRTRHEQIVSVSEPAHLER